MNELETLANLLSMRNQIDGDISKIIKRPANSGHLGEFIASKIFCISLEYSATTKGIDGRFTQAPLFDKTVNIKFYGKQEGILDIALDNLADYYLVLTGPKSQPATSRGGTRPFTIEHVYLFEMQQVVNELNNRGVKIGIATSIKKEFWDASELFPLNNNKQIILSDEQTRLLKLFSRL